MSAAVNRIRPRLVALEDRLLPSVYTVTNTNKIGPGSFEQALEDSSWARDDPTIMFDIPGPGVHTIERGNFQIDHSGTTLDATTQPGYAGQPLIELQGDGDRTGLWVNGIADCVIRGFAINRFPTAINMRQPGIIADNYIGTDPTGTVAMPNGIGVDSAFGHVIYRHNLISANGIGLRLDHYNTVTDNLIGTDASGERPLPNGVGISLVEMNNTIGGTAPGAGNVIAFNLTDGVQVTNDYLNGNGNLIWGNSIHDNKTGIKLMYGANRGILPPRLLSASVVDGQLAVSGILGTVSADRPTTLEVFGNDGWPAEGQRMLAHVVLPPSVTDRQPGVFRLSVDLAGLDPGRYVTATETDSLNDTSEFSRPVALTTPPMDLVVLATAPRKSGWAESF
jgi:hypothetical protein